METEKLNEFYNGLNISLDEIKDYYNNFVVLEILYYSNSKQFKKFIIVKLNLVLKSVILAKKLYLLYHKFCL